MKIHRGRLPCSGHTCTNVPVCTVRPPYSTASIKTIQMNKKLVLLQLCQIRFPSLQRSAAEITKNNYLAITWNSPPISTRTKNPIHIV